MRKMLMFAGLVLLGSMVGCTHIDSGCSSCGGCGNGLGHGDGYNGCIHGVCDCDIPALSPYGRGLGQAPQPLAPVPVAAAPAAAPAADQAAQAPREMPKANPEASPETPDK
jgi:hypothetical protein